MTDLDAAIRAKLDRQRDVMTLDDMFVSDITGNWQDALLAVLDLHGNYDTDPCLKLDDGAWWDPALFEDCPTVRAIAEKLEIGH